MKTLVAMPMKDLREAKTRLAAALSAAERAQLARDLFHRSQEFFARQFPEFTRLVVTPSEEIARLACAGGAWVLKEGGAGGLNCAADSAFGWARDAGFDRLLLVPGDIPVWLVGEVAALLEEGRRASIAIARAHDGGTNALLIDLRRVSEFAFRYGVDSAARHRQWCRSRGVSHAVAHLPFLSRDVDTEEDYLLLGRPLPASATVR
jgi:2-phospho-L-lactate guanylyltransferase